ncbi:MAG TPA: hypothetical protein VKS21_05050, partial [Spirochaetota bacterium]|nr:hypothetical protein [Spirochaetota bacterium]
MPRTLFFLLIINFSLAYRPHPYRYSVNGIQASGTGGMHAVPVLNTEALFNNPAALAFIKKNSITYEIKSGFHFIGIQEYALNLDAFSAMGVIFKSKKNRKKSPSWGLSFFNQFQSTPATDRGNIFMPAFFIKKLAWLKGWRLTPRSALGINAGLSVALEKKKEKQDIYYTTVFPGIDLGYIHYLNNYITAGIHLVHPLFLNWGLFHVTGLKETTPFIADLALKFNLNPGIDLYTELSYQGWDWVIYKNHNALPVDLDSGPTPVDPLQNIFLNFGISIKPELLSL